MWVICSWFEQSACKNWVIRLKNLYFLYVFDSFPFFMPKSKSLPSLFPHSLFFKDRLERFAPVAHYKRATVSNSLRLIMTKDWWVRLAVFHERIALSLTKKRANRSKYRWANSQPCNKALDQGHSFVSYAGFKMYTCIAGHLKASVMCIDVLHALICPVTAVWKFQ